MPPSDSEAPKFKLTRPMMITLGVLGILLVAVIVLGIFLVPRLLGGGQRSQVVARPTVAATAPIKVAEGQPTSAAQATVPPTVATREPVQATVPPASGGGGSVLPTAAQTSIPAPTVVQAGGERVAVQATVPAAGGEIQQLPGGSSGLTWLIPLGVVLLAAVAWWRWRRSRAEH